MATRIISLHHTLAQYHTRAQVDAPNTYSPAHAQYRTFIHTHIHTLSYALTQAPTQLRPPLPSFPSLSPTLTLSRTLWPLPTLNVIRARQVLLAETSVINRIQPIESSFPWCPRSPSPPLAMYRRHYKEYMLASSLGHVLYMRLHEGYNVDDVVKLYVFFLFFPPPPLPFISDGLGEQRDREGEGGIKEKEWGRK